MHRKLEGMRYMLTWSVIKTKNYKIRERRLEYGNSHRLGLKQTTQKTKTKKIKNT